MDWSAQRRRINRDAVLSQESPGAAVTATPGGQQEMLCLPLDSIRGWLFGTHAARVNPDVRERLIPYQHECYQVLAEAFQDSRLTTDTDIDIEVLLQQDSPAAQAYPMAVVRMARQQLVMEAELDAIVSKLTDHDEQLTDHTSRSISWSRPLGTEV